MEVIRKKIVQKKKKTEVKTGFIYEVDESVDYTVKILLKSNIVNLGHFDVYDNNS